MAQFPIRDESVERAHWLPFAAERGSPVVECDISGYFTPVESDKCLRSTFRGRNMCGVELQTDEFTSVISLPDQGSQRVKELIVWNHDDIPLKSDVAQQAINLARVQHFLGSSSGIE